MFDYRNSNYTYPEFVVHGFSEGAQISKAELVRRIELAFAVGGPSPQPVDTMAPFAMGAPQRSSFKEWVVRVRSSSRTVKQTFEVFVFLGEPPESSIEWPTSENLVGIHLELNNEYQDICPNCDENALIVSEGFISLRRVLEIRGLVDQEDTQIDQYLKENLRWRILKASTMYCTF